MCGSEGEWLTVGVERDGDDHTVAGADPQSAGADQQRRDPHEREAQLAGACHIADQGYRLRGLPRHTSPYPRAVRHTLPPADSSNGSIQTAFTRPLKSFFH